MALLLPRWSARAQGVPAPLPFTESFDETDGTVPPGWRDGSSGELSVVTGPEARQPKEGKGCWKVQVTAWDAGTARLVRPGIPLRRGAGSSVEVWLRSHDLPVPIRCPWRNPPPRMPPPPGDVCRRAGLAPLRGPGKSAGEDAAAALVISFRGAGALLVDGLRVQEGDPPGVAPGPIAEPVKGNRIFNGSFELGADGWTLAERVKLVREACPDGATFARLVPGPLPPLEGRPFPAQSGQRYTVSGYLRSSEPGARVEIAAVEVGGAARVGRTLT